MDVTTQEDDIDMDLEEAATPATLAPTPVMPTTSPITIPTITKSMMKGSQRRLDPKDGAIRWSGDWMADLEASRGRLAQCS